MKLSRHGSLSCRFRPATPVEEGAPWEVCNTCPYCTVRAFPIAGEERNTQSGICSPLRALPANRVPSKQLTRQSHSAVFPVSPLSGEVGTTPAPSLCIQNPSPDLKTLPDLNWPPQVCHTYIKPPRKDRGTASIQPPTRPPQAILGFHRAAVYLQ